MDPLLTFKQAVTVALSSSSPLEGVIAARAELSGEAEHCIAREPHDCDLVCPGCSDLDKIQDEDVRALCGVALDHYLTGQCKCATCEIVARSMVKLRGFIGD